MSDYGHCANNQLKLIPPFEFQEPEAEDFETSVPQADSDLSTGDDQLARAETGSERYITATS